MALTPYQCTRTQGVLAGQAVAGVAVSALSFLTLWASPLSGAAATAGSLALPAFLYFAVATATTALSAAAYTAMWRWQFVKAYWGSVGEHVPDMASLCWHLATCARAVCFTDVPFECTVFAAGSTACPALLAQDVADEEVNTPGRATGFTPLVRSATEDAMPLIRGRAAFSDSPAHNGDQPSPSGGTLTSAYTSAQQSAAERVWTTQDIVKQVTRPLSALSVIESSCHH